MTAPTLTLAVSTTASRLAGAWDVFRNLHDIDGIERLVLLQGQPADAPITEQESIRTVRLDSMGLSKSRNAALKEARGTYLWLLDDDVEIQADDVAYLLNELRRHTPDIEIGRIRCSDCDGFYKDYTRSRSGLLGVLRISSIEIVLNRDRINSHGIRFHEQLGLGSAYPSGEETLFLADAYRRGMRFHFSERSIVAHPCTLEARLPANAWRDDAMIRSKGIIARDMGGWRGPALCLWWGWRAVRYNQSLRPLSWMWTGFMKNYKEVIR